MKKLLLVLLSLLIFTGCKVKYELNIDEKFLNENINIDFEGDKVDQSLFYDQFALKNILYEKKFNNNNLSYSLSFSYDKYGKSLAIMNCYNKFEFTKEKSKYKIYAGEGFKCIPYQKNDYEFYDYDQLEIKFTTKYKVVNNNADLIDKNNYYWYITKENSQGKEIIFEFEKTSNSNVQLLICLGIMFAIIIITAIILITKKNQNNKI